MTTGVNFCSNLMVRVNNQLLNPRSLVLSGFSHNLGRIRSKKRLKKEQAQLSAVSLKRGRSVICQK